MSLVSATTKRDASASQISGKKRKLALELQNLVDEEDKNNLHNDLCYIMQHLLEHPAKIKSIKLALRSPTVKSDLAKDEYFNSSYTYLPKIPKSHLIGSTLLGMSTKMTQDNFKLVCSKGLRADLKLLYMGLGADGGQKIMSYHKATFDSMCKERALMMGNVLDHIKWSKEGEIDWGVCGLYRLLPEAPEGDATDEHKYTKAKCLALSPPEDEATDLEQLLCLQAFVIAVETQL